MRRSLKTMFFAVLIVAPALPAVAQDIDSLKGQYAFDWHKAPSKTRCAAVDDKLLATFKSDSYSCNLEVITNTASEQPARLCTEKGEGAEYMIFATEKSCELERTTQESNEE